MRADHAVLIGGRRRPGGGSLADIETAERDEADACPVRHEAVAADAELHIFTVGVFPLEVSVDDGLVPVLLRKPFIDGFLRRPRAGINLSRNAFFQRDGFVQHLIAEKYRAGVAHGRREVPVSANVGGIGVIRAEQFIVDPRDPDIALIGLPACQRLSARDHSAQRLHGFVYDPLILCAGILRVHIFAVNAGRHKDFVTGHGDLRRVIDARERFIFASIAMLGRIDVYIVNHGSFLQYISCAQTAPAH